MKENKMGVDEELRLYFGSVKGEKRAIILYALCQNQKNRGSPEMYERIWRKIKIYMNENPRM